MARFHIGRGGKSAVCSAKKGNCPFGGDDAHYSSREEAQSAAEKKMETEFGSNSSSKKSLKRDSERVSSFIIPNGTIETVKSRQGLDAIRWTGGNLIRLREETNSHNVSTSVIAQNLKNDLKTALKSGYLSNDYNYAIKEDKMGGLMLQATSKNNNPLENNTVKFTKDRGIVWDNENPETQKLTQNLEMMMESYQTKDDIMDKRGNLDYYSPDTNFRGHSEVGYKLPGTIKEQAEKSLTKEIVKMGIRDELNLSIDNPTEIINEAMRKNPKVRKDIIALMTAETHKKSTDTILKEVDQANSRTFSKPENQIESTAQQEIEQLNNSIKEKNLQNQVQIKEFSSKINDDNPSLEQAYENNPEEATRLSRLIKNRLNYYDAYNQFDIRYYNGTRK